MAVPTVLVTGASGFIATHIVRQLLKDGTYKVRGTVRSTKNEAKIAPLKQLWPDAKYPLELVEADLSEEAPWLDAVKGCTYVLHTASPFPNKNPKDENELIKPAVDGTLYVLRACRTAGGVKRVVLTSSVASISGVGGKDVLYTEKDWTDPQEKGLLPYAKSKTLAERAAWDFVEQLAREEKFELAVVNPSLVTGPPLSAGFSTSQDIPKRILEHDMPMVPKLHYSMIDVRDVAKAHINAITVPEAAGNRHILSNGGAWFSEIAKILDDEFKQQGYNVPTTVAPNFLIKINGLIDPSSRMIAPNLSQKTEYQNDRMTRVLGITPMSIKQSYIDMAYAMIEAGKIKKTRKYKGPPSDAN